MDENHIKSAVECVFNTTPEDNCRKMILKSYCKGIGGVKDYGTSLYSLCIDRECIPCRNFQNIFEEEINKQSFNK